MELAALTPSSSFESMIVRFLFDRIFYIPAAENGAAIVPSLAILVGGWQEQLDV